MFHLDFKLVLLLLAGLKKTFLNTDQIVLLYYFYLKFLRA